jgi:hypothetical protein
MSAGSRAVIALAAVLAGVAGCLEIRPSRGGGQAEFNGPRVASSEDVAVPEGYTVELVARGLTFPTGLAFDAAGRLHVVEAGYSYGEV